MHQTGRQIKRLFTSYHAAGRYLPRAVELRRQVERSHGKELERILVPQRAKGEESIEVVQGDAHHASIDIAVSVQMEDLWSAGARKRVDERSRIKRNQDTHQWSITQ